MAGPEDFFNTLFWIKKKKKVVPEDTFWEPIVLAPKIRTRTPSLYELPLDDELPVLPGKPTKKRKVKRESREEQQVLRQELPDITPKNTHKLDFRNNLWGDTQRLLALEETIKTLSSNFLVNQRMIQSLIRREYESLWLEWKAGTISAPDLNKLKFLHYLTFEYYAANLARDPARTYTRTKPSTRDNKFLQDAWFGNVWTKPEDIEYPYIDRRINAPKELYGSAVYQDVLKSLSSGNTYKQYWVWFNPNTLFSNGNVTLVVKDAKGLNVQLIYRNWKLYVAAYISPGSGNNTPQGIFRLDNHAVADFVNKDDKWDLMPSAIRLYPAIKRGERLTFDIDDGFRSHGNPISKKWNQYGITGQNISSGCFRTPGIAQMLNYHVTFRDTDISDSKTYLLYDPTIKLTLPKIVQAQVYPQIPAEKTLIDVNTLDVQILIQRNISLHGKEEIGFFKDFFAMSSDTQMIQKIVELQSTHRIIADTWILTPETLEKIYTAEYFTNTSKYSQIKQKIDAVVSSQNPEQEVRNLVQEIFSRYPNEEAVSIVRYISYRYHFWNKNSKNSFSAQTFFWPWDISDTYFTQVEWDSSTQKVLMDYRIIGSFPSSLWETIDKLGLGITELAAEGIGFVFKESVDTDKYVLVTFKNGSLLSVNYINIRGITGDFTVGDDTFKKSAKNGSIPYMYAQYVTSSIPTWSKIFVHKNKTYLD